MTTKQLHTQLTESFSLPKLIDFTKARTEAQIHINKLYEYSLSNLKVHKASNSNFICYAHSSSRFRLEFRKIISQGMLVGFRWVDVCFSPHYLFNNDLHNGNDLNAIDCIRIIKSLYANLGISHGELRDFRIVNLEYGLNLLTPYTIEQIMNGLLYTSKKKFITKDFPTNKISDSTKFKQIKAYGKGVQFLDFPQYNIHPDTFRFEVRSKESKKITAEVGVYSVADLIKPESYNKFAQSLMDEWQRVLIVKEGKEQNVGMWECYTKQHRNKFGNEKSKYYAGLPRNDNMHHTIKCTIIDKILELTTGANSTRKSPINSENTKTAI